MKTQQVVISIAILPLWIVFGARLTLAAEMGVPASSSKGVYGQLIEGARKEKQVYLFPMPDGSDEVIQGFRGFLQRLGLNLELKVDNSGQSFAKMSQAIGETKQGVTPTYDVQFGAAHEIIHLLGAKGVKHIDNVEQLLSEIAPQAIRVLDQISPGPFRSRSFTFGHWIDAMIYNPRLISAEELPKTHKELGEPKYKGAFAIPPWTSDAEAALLVYDKEAALDIIKAIGRNKGATEAGAAAVNRMLLGEFKFVGTNAHYYYQYKSKDARAPIGVGFYQDFTAVTEAMYFVRQGARNPNGATLFVLWMLGEGQEVHEKATSQPNLYLPSSQIGREILGMFKSRKVKMVSWVENEESLKKLRWLGETQEGKEWTKAVAQAWRGR